LFVTSTIGDNFTASNDILSFPGGEFIDLNNLSSDATYMAYVKTPDNGTTLAQASPSIEFNQNGLLVSTVNFASNAIGQYWVASCFDSNLTNIQDIN